MQLVTVLGVKLDRICIFGPDMDVQAHIHNLSLGPVTQTSNLLFP